MTVSETKEAFIKGYHIRWTDSRGDSYLFKCINKIIFAKPDKKDRNNRGGSLQTLVWDGEAKVGVELQAMRANSVTTAYIDDCEVVMPAAVIK